MQVSESDDNSNASSFICHRIVNSVCCSRAMVCGPTSMRLALDGGLYSGQLLMM